MTLSRINWQPKKIPKAYRSVEILGNHWGEQPVFIGLQIDSKKTATKKDLALIQILTKKPYTRVWYREQVWVDAKEIAPRVIPCAFFGEEMVVTSGDLVISAGPLKLGATAFPGGFCYGTLNGIELTTPEHSQSRAIEMMLRMLVDGIAERNLKHLLEGAEAGSKDNPSREKDAETYRAVLGLIRGWSVSGEAIHMAMAMDMAVAA